MTRIPRVTLPLAAAGFDGGQPIYAPFDPIAGGWAKGLI